VSANLPPTVCEPAPGTFLVAAPTLLDPNFMHTVVLVCSHGPQGTYGLIVNRRTDRNLAELESDAPLLEGREDAIYVGGPVAGDRLQIIHRLGDDVPGGLPVLGDVRLGGDPDVLRERLLASGESRIRFVLGCSGWGEGQLDAEIQEGAWVVCEAREGLVFDPEPDTLWRRVLRSLGPPYAELADLPPDPRWN
jgi:putative transcriptional regulator